MLLILILRWRPPFYLLIPLLPDAVGLGQVCWDLRRMEPLSSLRGVRGVRPTEASLEMPWEPWPEMVMSSNEQNVPPSPVEVGSIISSRKPHCLTAVPGSINQIIFRALGPLVNITFRVTPIVFAITEQGVTLHTLLHRIQASTEFYR